MHEGPQLWRIKSAQDFKINAGTDFVYKVFEVITILKSLDMYVHPCAINFQLSKKFMHVCLLFFLTFLRIVYNKSSSVPV